MPSSWRLSSGSSRSAAAEFSRLLKHLFDNFPARRQIIILGEVGENIVAVFLRHPLSPLGEGGFGDIRPERVASGIFLPRHLSLAREKPVDKNSRGIGVGRAVDKRDGSGARAQMRALGFE